LPQFGRPHGSGARDFRRHNKAATLSIKLAAIAYKHREAGQADPTKNVVIQKVMTNIKRKHGSKPSKKAPITFDELKVMVGKLDASILAGKRDKALILLGFAGAFRRSELVGLDVEDLHINGDLKVSIKRSRTDQEGRGMVKVIPSIPGSDIDPITALLDWLDAADIKSGPVFRQIDRWGNARADRLTPQSVALIIKAVAEAAGLATRQYAGHSMRSGFITSAVVAGMSLNDIAEVSGHKSLDVLRGYVQDAGAGGRRAILKVFGSEE
jgi:integrase